eukprot:CAMPEP_0201903278 /NCGR_PEP_ID=MMETSP0902-20130614/55392_1 /ASSEMBLY_ACC=CAM_ASM_000551 /TAXON_ID=420261 /ORGANISM="Thalassiosira antarctica, Strain CCMP982" /LENGTH=957 /DNA_ID=CAMNT_0048437315 /DNA_START=11 /DNA_END=2884 /DNA_ORIENTATION=+
MMSDLRSSDRMNGVATETVKPGSFFTSFLRQFRKQSIPELIESGDKAVIDGNNEDALRHYYNALEKEQHAASDDSSLQAALILRKIGLALSRTGDSFAAMSSFEDALQIQQEKLGPGSEDAAETTAEMLNILDGIRVQSGVGERQFVKGDNGSAITSLDVGTNLLEWGEYKEAEVVLKNCLKSMNDNDDSKNDERIKVLGAMAELDRAQGKYDEAKERYLEVLKTAKKMNANSDEEVDISIINSIAGYAEILRKAGDLWQAEALHRKVRNMLMASKFTQETEGSGNDTVLQLAISHTQLGCTVFALKKYDDAWQEHKSALDIRLRVLEVTDSLVSESFNYCAETLTSMGREAEALPLSLQAVEIRAREFGTSHPAYAHALCVLSKCYHGVGRSQDAMPLIEKCLEICESVFTENHANIIPNLIVQGDIFQAVGELEKSLTTFQRALSIHKTNFKPGQKEFQLEECEQKMKDVMTALKDEMAFGPSESMLNEEDNICAGTPMIVITDIGRDIDDALAIVMLSSLKKMFILNPLACIVTLAPEEDRACLARTVLDSLGMHDVPVGLGTDVACPGEISLRCFNGVAHQNPFHFERASSLMSRILTEAEPKSVKILCLANLKDISELIVKQEVLFRTKVKEVIIMGGAEYSEARQQLIPDETAFNNNCDLYSTRHVYAECQQNHIPTTTISRYAAYGCPLSISFLDGLQNTNHLLAGEIRNANFKSMQQLWKKVNLPSWMPGRGKLPARCNREWFLDFFKVKVDDTTDALREIWHGSALYLYDSLATLSCVDAYVDFHFTPKCYMIENCLHRVIGTPSSSGVANKDYLVNEMEGLLHQAFALSLEGMDMGMNRNNTSEKLEDERPEKPKSSEDSDDGSDAGGEYDEKKDERPKKPKSSENSDDGRDAGGEYDEKKEQREGMDMGTNRNNTSENLEDERPETPMSSENSDDGREAGWEMGVQ